MVWLWIPSGLFQVAPETIKGSRNQPVHANHNNSNPSGMQQQQQLPVHHFVLEIRTTKATVGTQQQQPNLQQQKIKEESPTTSEYIICDGASWVAPSLYPFTVLGHTHPAQPQSQPSGSGTKATTLCIMEDNTRATTSSPSPKINIATKMTSSRIRSWFQQSEWRTLVMECGGGEEGDASSSSTLSTLERSLLHPSTTQGQDHHQQGVRLFTPGASSSTQLYIHVPPPSVTSSSTTVFRVTLDPVHRSLVHSLLQSATTSTTTTTTTQEPTQSDCDQSQQNNIFTRVNTAIGSSSSLLTNSLHPALLTRDPQNHIKACVVGTAVVPGAYIAVPEDNTNGSSCSDNIYYFRVASVEKKRVQIGGSGGSSSSFEPTTQLATISPSTVLRLNLSSRGAVSSSSDVQSVGGCNDQDTPKVVGLESQQQQCVQLIRRAIYDAQTSQHIHEEDGDSFTSSSHSHPLQSVPPTTTTILFAGPSGCGKHTLLSSALQQATYDLSNSASSLCSVVVDTIHVNWGLVGESAPTTSAAEANPLALALQSAGSSGDVSAKRIAETLSSKSVPTLNKNASSSSSCPVIVCVLNIASGASEFPPDDSRLTRMNQERLSRGIYTIEAALRQTVENGVARSTTAWPQNAADGTPLIGFVFVVAAFADSVRAVHQLATSSTFNHGIISTPMTSTSTTNTTTNPATSKKAVCVASGVCEVPRPGLTQRERLVAQSFSSTTTSTLSALGSDHSDLFVVGGIIDRIGAHGARAAARYLMGASGRDCVRVGNYLHEYLTQGLVLVGASSYVDFAQRVRHMFNITTTMKFNNPTTAPTTTNSTDDELDALVANILGIQPLSDTTHSSPSPSSYTSMVLAESISAKLAPTMMKLIRTPGLLHGGTLSSGGGLPEEGSAGGTTWDDIGGLVEVKDRLRQALIRPRLHPEAYKRFNITPPRGILLYGPPGCAKTTLVKALCNEGLYSFIYVDCASVLSSYVGESEQFLRDVFAKGRAQAPCIVFFDEVEGVSGNRAPASGGGSDSARLLSTLLIEIDGFAGGGDGNDDSSASDAHVCFVGATNLPQLVDPALLRPGRFDYLVYVPLPSASERYSILVSVLQRGHRRGVVAATTTTLSNHDLLDDDIVSDLTNDPSAFTLMSLEIVVQQYADCVLDPSSIGFFSTTSQTTNSDVVVASDAATVDALLQLPTDFVELEALAEGKQSAMEALLAEITVSGKTRQQLLISALRASAAETLVSLCEGSTDGFSGADLTSLVKEAAAIRQRITSSSTTGGYPPRCNHITLRDIEAATLKVSPVDFDTTAMENFRETH